MLRENSSLLWQHIFPRGKQGQQGELGGVDTTTTAIFLTDKLVLLDTATGKIRRSIPIRNGLKTFSLPPGVPPRFLTYRYQKEATNANAPKLLEAWDAQRDVPAWSIAAAPQVVAGDGKWVVWSELDQSVTCVNQNDGKVQWQLPPENGGEPIAVIKGQVYLRTGNYKGVYGQFMRLVDAANGRILSTKLYDASESVLFHQPGLLLRPNNVVIVSETRAGVGFEEFTLRAVDLANDRLGNRTLWVKSDLRADGLFQDMLLCTAVGRLSVGSYGLDVRTGRVRWSIKDRPYKFVGAYGSFWVALRTSSSSHGRVGSEAVKVVGVRPQDGKEAWSFPLFAGAGIVDVRLVSDRLIVWRGVLDKAGSLAMQVYHLP